jgi:hypothetical protein
MATLIPAIGPSADKRQAEILGELRALIASMGEYELHAGAGLAVNHHRASDT